MQSFLDPAILFFVFGILAGALKSNLEIPPQISRFLSLYLLMALGLKGGFALAKSGLTPEVLTSLGAALLLAVVVPAAGYLLLRRVVSGYDAAAIAATYGSVSAVTFITDTPKPKQLVIDRAVAAEVAEREAGRMIRLAIADKLVYEWSFPRDNAAYLATVPQPVTATEARP